MQIKELNFSQEIFTRDRLTEEARYSNEIVQLSLLKDNLLRGLEQRTQERDVLQQTKIQLTNLVHEDNTRITEIETDNAQLLRSVEQKDQMIAHLQA